MTYTSLAGRTQQRVVPIVSFRPTKADRERIKQLQAVLEAQGIYRPTTTDAVRVALEEAVRTLTGAV
jgi:hypothetical protein